MAFLFRFKDGGGVIWPLSPPEAILADLIQTAKYPRAEKSLLHALHYLNEQRREERARQPEGNTGRGI